MRVPLSPARARRNPGERQKAYAGADLRKLREADRMLGEGKAVAEVAKDRGVSEHTFRRWRNPYGPDQGPLVFGSHFAALHRQVAARNIEAGAMFFWIDQGPVSMAAAREFGDGVAQIGPVYTLPDRRRRGYGGALTATATQRMLDQACTACTLFTDLRNATSNHIYREIGYKPVADFHEFWFQPRS